jgi:hypothetical protein
MWRWRHMPYHRGRRVGLILALALTSVVVNGWSNVVGRSVMRSGISARVLMVGVFVWTALAIVASALPI